MDQMKREEELMRILDAFVGWSYRAAGFLSVIQEEEKLPDWVKERMKEFTKSHDKLAERRRVLCNLPPL
jgi:hypothetical protein